MADRVGQQLGNYRLMHLIGQGGFAEVYLGEHVHLGTQTAIKVLRTRLVESEEVERFQQEARTIAHLEHPHIVRVLDFAVQEGTPFLILGYAPNGNLRKRHPRGAPLPLSTIVDYVKQVVDALQYAHERKVIHRDIKPENMLVGRHYEILLTDFGIALLAQTSRLQSIQEVAGTAHYMAPEQLQGKPRLASDQYALGIVVYEWLCGRCPFKGSFVEIASQHVLTPPPPLSEMVPMIVPEVEQVVLTALEKDPHRRFGSVQAFATALEQACQTASYRPAAPPRQLTFPSEPSIPTNQTARALQSQSPLSTNIVIPPNQALVTASSHSAVGLPPLTKEPARTGESQRSKRRLSRRTVVGGLAGITGLAIVGGGITWLVLSTSPTSTTQQSATPTSTTTSQSSTLYTYHSHTDTVTDVTWSPDGNRIASASGDKTVQVWDAADGGHVFTYHGHSSAGQSVSAVAWSPDGKRIASSSSTCVNGGNTVQVWDAATGKRTSTYTGHRYHVTALAWSPDGTRIASASDKVNEVQVWEVTTGKRIFTYNQQNNGVTAVAWSPDGTRIASADEASVNLWDAANGDNSWTYPGYSIPLRSTYAYFGISSLAWSPDSKHIASSDYREDYNTYDDSYEVQVWQAS